MNTTKYLLAYFEKVGTITSTFHLKSTTFSDRDLTLAKDERKQKKSEKQKVGDPSLFLPSLPAPCPPSLRPLSYLSSLLTPLHTTAFHKKATALRKNR